MFICICLCTGMYTRVQEPVEAKGIVYLWSWIRPLRASESGCWGLNKCFLQESSILFTEEPRFSPSHLCSLVIQAGILVTLLPVHCCTIDSLLQAYVCFLDLWSCLHVRNHARSSTMGFLCIYSWWFFPPHFHLSPYFHY